MDHLLNIIRAKLSKRDQGMMLPNNPRDEQKNADPIDKYRKLEAYTRLKTKFEQLKYQEGIPAIGLTVGDIVDILSVYLNAAESSSEGKGKIIAIAVEHTLGKSSEKPGDEILQELKILSDSGTVLENLNREHPLYSTNIDLEVATAKMDPSGGSSIDLSHYPGGIMISKKSGRNIGIPGYEILLTNRQQADQGKTFIADLFNELKLPIRSSIA